MRILRQIKHTNFQEFQFGTIQQEEEKEENEKKNRSKLTLMWHEVKFEHLEALRQSFSHANNTQDLSKKRDKMKIRVAENNNR